MRNRTYGGVRGRGPQGPSYSMCAGHGAYLGGESPLRADSNRSASLGKGAAGDSGSEGSRWQNKAVTYRN
jgi:hypothetical protein